MRDEKTIRHKFKQVCFRHLKKLLRANFRKKPHTCKFNRMVAVGGNPSNQVGVCYHAEGSDRTICDSRVNGSDEHAAECLRWAARMEKAHIKSEFYKLIQSDRGIVASEYPDIAALLWVMDTPDVSEDCREIDIAIDEIPDEEFWL